MLKGKDIGFQMLVGDDNEYNPLNGLLEFIVGIQVSELENKLRFG